ncbi:MAG: YggT family protein [Acidobacteria bacterium]|nr:YggT family protein [Acidobacteriota bacterium]
MAIIFTLLYLVLLLFFVALMVRLVFDWVQMLARSWRPKGAALVAASAVYAVTDPPLRFLRRLIPPLRIGAVSLDVGFMLLVFVLGIAMYVTASFAA